MKMANYSKQKDVRLARIDDPGNCNVSTPQGNPERSRHQYLAMVEDGDFLVGWLFWAADVRHAATEEAEKWFLIDVAFSQDDEGIPIDEVLMLWRMEPVTEEELVPV